MFLIIDLIILVISAFCIFLGYQRGLAKCAIKILSFVIALAISFMFYKPVGNIIKKNTEIDDSIKGAITQIIENDTEEDGQIKEESNLPQSMVDHINNEIKTNVNKTKEAVVTTAAEDISNTAINVISWIGIFIVVRLLLLILTLVFSVLTELPVLKQVDKIGGIIYGVLQAAIILFVIFTIISFISPMIEQTGIISMINKSFIGSVLYNYNPIMKLF